MRYQGRITVWNEDRGFGFIEWNGGSDKLFLHVSAFTDRGRRPRVGDIVTYEAVKGEDGRFKAEKVGFAGAPLRKPAAEASSSRYSFAKPLLPVILLTAIGVGAYQRWRPPAAPDVMPVAAKPVASRADSPYRCEGKTRCPEMSSCAEASFYQRNCPGTQMDGDGDGIPCEDQWCGH
ncbi:MAG TPA: cold shock domain-containing protein [Solimonas sp.]|nr:cold shock domain-containing protein [Solimonas sp.]